MATKYDLTTEAIAERRATSSLGNQVVFAVRGLQGLSRTGVRMPISEHDAIDSGPVTLTTDADADYGQSLGIIDYERHQLKVRYAAQIVFPGLYQLITDGSHDRNLLNPVRATATDRCTVAPDYRGWHAQGTLEFLPGSLWAGAEGG